MIEPFLERWPWPDGTPITQEFGDMFSGYPHRGRDAGTPNGTPIVAEAYSTVVQATNDGTFGQAVCLDYGNGLYGLHAHNSEVLVPLGARVRAGQQIALSGNTGYSTGPHCHFQLCVNTQFPTDISYSRDPRDYIITEDTDMTPEQIASLERGEAAYKALTGGFPGTVEWWNSEGYALLPGYLGKDMNGARLEGSLGDRVKQLEKKEGSS